jgi:hypothetical protein
MEREGDKSSGASKNPWHLCSVTQVEEVIAGESRWWMGFLQIFEFVAVIL